MIGRIKLVAKTIVHRPLGYLFATILLLAPVCLSIGHAQVLKGRLSPPEPVEIARARIAIQDAFGAEIGKARTSITRKALATRMLVAANDAQETAANRWVLYGQAADLAAKGGDVALTKQALDEQTRAFTWNRTERDAEVAEKLAESTVSDSRSLLDFIYPAATEAIDADDFQSAVRLLNLGLTVAKRLKKDTLTQRQFETRLRSTQELVKAIEAAKGDEEAMGRVYCFRKESWERGLPLLAKAKDANLVAVVKTDLSKPFQPKDRFDLGDAWFSLAEKSMEPEKTAMMMRAYHWFRQARPDLNGLKKIKADKAMSLAPRQYLIDMDEFDVKLGPWKFGKGILGGDEPTPISINGKLSPSGLTMHPPNNDFASVKYRLGKSAKTFKSNVAIDDSAGGSVTPITFQVFGDGKQLWASKPIKLSRQPQSCQINVTGVAVLELHVVCPGRYEGAYGVWVEPHVTH